MKRLPFIFLFATALLTAIFTASCNDDDTVDYSDIYEEWGKPNDAWLAAQADSMVDGERFYTPLKPEWLSSSGVLIHYFNDRALTEGNLSPWANSRVKVKYRGEFYNGVPFDSSYAEVDSCRTFTLGSDLIMGWRIALNYMRVGDSADVVVPWQQAYGIAGNTGIPSFSNLKFTIKLVDIPDYEKR